MHETALAETSLSSSEPSERRSTTVSWRLLGLVALAAVVFVAVFLIVESTYFYNDDFFLLYFATTYGPSWSGVAHPVYGHCGPGAIWVAWLIGKLGGLDRTADAIGTGLISSALFLLTYSLTYPTGPSSRDVGRRALAAFLACLTAVAPLSLLYLALGDASLPMAFFTLSSTVLLIRAGRTGNLLLAVAAGLLCGASFLFWELALTNAVVVPLLCVALLAGWHDGDLRRALREIGVRCLVAFEVPALISVGLYTWNYRTGGYGSGVPPPSAYQWLSGTVRWIPHALLPSLGGGPVPVEAYGGGPIRSGSGVFTQADVYVPLLIGAAIAVVGLVVRRTRYLMATVLVVGTGQGLVTVYARWRYEGGGIYLSATYVANMLSFYLVLFSTLWMQLFSLRLHASRRLMGVLGVALVASAGLSLLAFRMYVEQWGGGDRRHYVETSLQEIGRAPATDLLLAGGVPAYLGFLPVPFNTTEALLSPAVGSSRWRVGVGTPRVLDSDGRWVTAVEQDRQTSAAAAAGSCATTVELGNPLPADVVQRTVLVQLTSPVNALIDLQISNDTFPVSLIKGSNLVVHQTFGSASPVILHAVYGVCIGRVEAYVAGQPP